MALKLTKFDAGIPAIRAIVPGVLAFALAACGGSADDPEADRASAPDGDVTLQPGLYRTQVSLAGGPQGGATSQFADDNQCFTPEDVEGGYRAMLLAMQGDGACRFDSYELDGTRLEAVMMCKGDQFQPETEARISGEVTPTSSDLTMTVAGFGEGEGGGGGVEMRVTSELVGECAGSAE